MAYKEISDKDMLIQSIKSTKDTIAYWEEISSTKLKHMGWDEKDRDNCIRRWKEILDKEEKELKELM